MYINPDEDTISALVPSSGEPARESTAEEAVNVAVTNRPADLAASTTSPGGSPKRKASLAKQGRYSVLL